MKGQIANYAFAASTKLLIVSGFSQTPRPESFLLITNATRGVIYHSPFDSTKVATFGSISYNGTTYSIQLTLNAAVSTSGHADSDKIHIVYDFPQPDNSSYPLVQIGGRTQDGITTVVPLAAISNALTVRDENAGTKLTSIDADIGATADTAASTDTGTFSLISLFKRLLSRITSLVPANLTVTSTRLLVDGSGVTQPVSANSLPLPSGAATATNQSATNALLGKISQAPLVKLGTLYSSGTTDSIDISSLPRGSYLYIVANSTAVSPAVFQFQIKGELFPQTLDIPPKSLIDLSTGTSVTSISSNGFYIYKIQATDGSVNPTGNITKIRFALVSPSPTNGPTNFEVYSIADPLFGTGTLVSPFVGAPISTSVTKTTGSIASASVSQQALPASSTRKYLLIQNISDTDMYCNFGSTATTDNFLLTKNGGGLVFESGYVPTDSVTVICPLASKKYFILSA